jgi:hypothetical protein
MLPRCCRSTTVSIPDSPSNGRTHPQLRSQPRLSFSHFTEPKQHRCTSYHPRRSIQCPSKPLTRSACSMQLPWSPSTAARFPLLFCTVLQSAGLLSSVFRPCSYIIQIKPSGEGDLSVPAHSDEHPSRVFAALRPPGSDGPTLLAPSSSDHNTSPQRVTLLLSLRQGSLTSPARNLTNSTPATTLPPNSSPNARDPAMNSEKSACGDGERTTHPDSKAG